MGHTGPAPLLASLALGSISSNISYRFGDLPSGRVHVGMSRAHSCEVEETEGHPTTAALTAQGEADPAR